MSSNAHAPLAIDDLRRARAAARFGAVIHYFDTIDSTNTIAQQLARDGAAEGTVVIAETQTKGRGRLGRTWISPPLRNLYLSIVLRPPIAIRRRAASRPGRRARHRRDGRASGRRTRRSSGRTMC